MVENLARRGRDTWWPSWKTVHRIPPWSLTWNLKISPWNRRFLFYWNYHFEVPCYMGSLSINNTVINTNHTPTSTLVDECQWFSLISFNMIFFFRLGSPNCGSWLGQILFQDSVNIWQFGKWTLASWYLEPTRLEISQEIAIWLINKYSVNSELLRPILLPYRFFALYTTHKKGRQNRQNGACHPRPSRRQSADERWGPQGQCFPTFPTVEGKKLPSRELTYPPKNGILKMIFLFARWDMLIPWRVNQMIPKLYKTLAGPC